MVEGKILGLAPKKDPHLSNQKGPPFVKPGRESLNLTILVKEEPQVLKSVILPQKSITRQFDHH